MGIEEESKTSEVQGESSSQENSNNPEENKNVEEDVKDTEAQKNPTELESKIIRQVEYYFGDFNLVKDRFLQEQIKQDDGWIPLETMVKFNRLKILSTDFEVIRKALEKSPTQLLQISEDGNKIRRDPSKPLPEKTKSYQDEMMSRTAYAKGFPRNTRLDDILEFFESYGKVENVVMRRFPNSPSFRGSVFATFDRKEDAEKFVAAKDIKFKNISLLRQMNVDYKKRKETEYQERLKKKEEKEKLKENQAREEEDDDNDNDQEFDEEEIVKGCVIKLSGLAKNISRMDIKEVFNPHATVAYVEYNIEDPEAFVRFAEEGVATFAVEKVLTGEGDDKKLVICDTELKYEVLEGEEEQQYWKRFAKTRAAWKKNIQKNNSSSRGRRGFGRKRGGGSGRRGRGPRGGRQFNQEDRNGKEEAKLKTTEQKSPIKTETTETSEGEPPAKRLRAENSETSVD
ncbi:la protein homolog [Limulus polyphemus]|uniref:La protein homolog n=1 Tax=Limulus polyphemus TaxID=6850 RepID=A0ABM1BQB2_LIMPO|nr:la protein homolog [Limulus polyphemus]